MARLVGYFRLTLIPGDPATDVAIQKCSQRLIDFAAKNGHEIVEINYHVGSGSDFMPPALCDALVDLETADGMLLEGLDSISKTSEQKWDVVEQITEGLKKRLLLISESIDTSTTEGKQRLEQLRLQMQAETFKK